MSVNVDDLKQVIATAESIGDMETASVALIKLEEISKTDHISPTYTEDEQKSADDGIWTTLNKRMQERNVELNAILDSTLKKDIKTGRTVRQVSPETLLQLTGKGIGASYDIMGTILTPVVKTAWGITKKAPGVISDALHIPSDTQESVRSSFEKTLDSITTSVVADKAVEALQGGVKSYSEFKKNNPNAARDIESVVNIGTFLVPIKARANAAPSPLVNAADALKLRADNQILKSKEKYLSTIITPKKTEEVLMEEAKRSTTKKGLFGETVVTPLSRDEQNMINIIKNVDGISPNKTVVHNINSTQSALDKSVVNLERSLDRANIVIPRTSSQTMLDNVITDLGRIPKLVTGDASKVAQATVSAAKTFIDAEPNTAAGMLRARKNFDSWIRKQGKSGALETDAASTAQNLAVKATRNAMNNTIETFVNQARSTTHGTNILPFVKNELSKQSYMIDAIDNMAYHSLAESKTAVGRQIQNIGKLVNIKNKTAQDIAPLIGKTAFGAGVILAAGLPAALTAAGITYVGGKAILSPGAKKGLARLLELSDKALITSTNPSMIKQIRADRAVIIDLLKYSEESQEESSNTQ